MHIILVAGPRGRTYIIWFIHLFILLLSMVGFYTFCESIVTRLFNTHAVLAPVATPVGRV
jgi:hypothetical protein